MSNDCPRIVMITAGAGGMYCGSCLQDNALAAAMTKLGIDIQLVATYTPIRTDELDQTGDQVFFGGINVYLQQKLPLVSRLPRFLTRWLDNPGFIRMVTSRGMETNAAMLGNLTLSMLKGKRGRQAIEVRRLVDWLETHGRPEVVHFSNMLISGCAESIKQRLNVPVIVTLQGDDLFLSQLTTEYESAALAELRRIDQWVDAYVVHSQFYADKMASYLGVDRAKFRKIPLAISTEDFSATSQNRPANRPPTVGYVARLAPEKGLHVLVDAFLQLRSNPTTAGARLIIGGWLGQDQQDYAEQLFQKLTEQAGAASYEYRGELTREQKRTLLADIDIMSVPTTYEEPKGLYLLEALASGKPAVQPNHGVFPELLESTAGGHLFTPHDASSLAETLASLLTDEPQRAQLGQAGLVNVAAKHSAAAAALALKEIYAKQVNRDGTRRSQ